MSFKRSGDLFRLTIEKAFAFIRFIPTYLNEEKKRSKNILQKKSQSFSFYPSKRNFPFIRFIYFTQKNTRIKFYTFAKVVQ